MEKKNLWKSCVCGSYEAIQPWVYFWFKINVEAVNSIKYHKIKRIYKAPQSRSLKHNGCFVKKKSRIKWLVCGWTREQPEHSNLESSHEKVRVLSTREFKNRCTIMSRILNCLACIAVHTHTDRLICSLSVTWKLLFREKITKIQSWMVMMMMAYTNK